VDDASNFSNYERDKPNKPNPLFCPAPIPIPNDPLINVPVPQISSGVVLNYQGSQSFKKNFHRLRPGIYDSITITHSASVLFTPGIYVLAYTGRNPGNSLEISGSATVTGHGVMFYNTSGRGPNRYDPASGFPDANDGNRTPQSQSGFGQISIESGANVDLSGIADSNSPFYGMLFYQRRWNTQPLVIGNNPKNLIFGQVYAKWAPAELSSDSSGTVTYNAQFVVGRMTLSWPRRTSGTMLIDPGTKPDGTTSDLSNLGAANQVFLVQ
jgi:hypothetical protein